MKWVILAVQSASLSRRLRALDLHIALTITKRRQAFLVIVTLWQNLRTSLTWVLPKYKVCFLFNVCACMLFGPVLFSLNYPARFHKKYQGSQETNASASTAPLALYLTSFVINTPSLWAFPTLSFNMLILVLPFCHNRPQGGYNAYSLASTYLYKGAYCYCKSQFVLTMNNQ